MSEIYLSLLGLVVIGGALAWLGKIAFDGLFGRESPWNWSWLSRSFQTSTENPKLNRLIFALDIVGLTIAAGIFGWHFGVRPLPELLLWSVALPLALVCSVGRAKALLRRFRQTPKSAADL
ncbi:MAG: hypothetical protein ABL871_18170 [Terricaulis sp.]